jgi:hypothetical protein
LHSIRSCTILLELLDQILARGARLLIFGQRNLPYAMGRPAHPIVSTYFNRGVKKENSNRYSYTCRGCSHHFETGRLEQLMSHITRHCTAFSPEERDRIANTNRTVYSKPKLARELLKVAELEERPSYQALDALVAANAPDENRSTPPPSEPPEVLLHDQEYEDSLGAMLSGALYGNGQSMSDAAITPENMMTPTSGLTLSPNDQNNSNAFLVSHTPGVSPPCITLAGASLGVIGPTRSHTVSATTYPYPVVSPAVTQRLAMRAQRACIRCRMLRKTVCGSVATHLVNS